MGRAKGNAGQSAAPAVVEGAAAAPAVVESNVLPVCHFKICVDPATGRTVMTPETSCPRGMVDEIEHAMMKRGVEIVHPRRDEKK